MSNTCANCQRTIYRTHAYRQEGEALVHLNCDNPVAGAPTQTVRSIPRAEAHARQARERLHRAIPGSSLRRAGVLFVLIVLALLSGCADRIGGRADRAGEDTLKNATVRH